jgi:hypothetical protein
VTQRRSSRDILTGLDADRRLAVLHSDDTSGAQGWDADPTPLTPRRLTPPFPVDALPAWVADMVLAIAEFTQTPLDLPGCLALAALSTAAGGRAQLEVRPGWKEPLNLYTVVAMPPGSRKSAVFAAMTAPLLEAERQLVEQARPRIAEAELARRVATAEAERRAKQATNTRDRLDREEALASAADAAVEADQIIVPPMPRLIADDVTTEAAASLLAEQGGRLAVLSAEGGIFSTLAGRYSGGVPSLEVFLKGHAGDLLRVDRKGRPAEHVAAPALTLGLALQPEVLTDIARMPGFRGRGLLARILYSLPENTVGRRRIGAPAVPATIDRAYSASLSRLVVTLAAQRATTAPPRRGSRPPDPGPGTEPGAPPRPARRSRPHHGLGVEAHRRRCEDRRAPPCRRAAPDGVAPARHPSPRRRRRQARPVLPRPRPGSLRPHARRSDTRRRPARPGLDRSHRPHHVHPPRGILRTVETSVPQGLRARLPSIHSRRPRLPPPTRVAGIGRRRATGLAAVGSPSCVREIREIRETLPVSRPRRGHGVGGVAGGAVCPARVLRIARIVRMGARA